jgi:deoxyadenosine/deoxycytidine kinase
VNAAPRYIAIEGVIGAGKTTLASMLAARLDHELILERFEENPFLPLFYADPVRHAFATQIFFLLSRYRQQKELREIVESGRPVVSDYIFDKDRIFASLTLRKDDLELYDAVATPLGASLPSPDLIIYLRSSVERAVGNIRRRGRPMERVIGEQYIGRLAERYERFLAVKRPSQILVVETEGLDLLHDPRAFNELLEEIVRPTDAELRSIDLTK